ncbi:MAG: hypothetical protein ACREJO_09575 [Phycisphaerales bacterium]
MTCSTKWVVRLGSAAVLGFVAMVGGAAGVGKHDVQLRPASSVDGYVARLLINETPFPGERGWVSEEDTKGAMLAILWVLDCRLKHIPEGYTQSQIASEPCRTIIDVITAGGEKGQCDGFYRNDAGEPASVSRVNERIDYLVACANKGQPGRFARLLDYASHLAASYVEGGIDGADRYAGLEVVGRVDVTGRAYSWMSDHGNYSPGGNFVRIPDSDQGAQGGNRFFTLRKLP